jgi:hypothetical protein
MTHVAMQQPTTMATSPTWGEHVSDEQYAHAPSIGEEGR